MSRVLIVEPDAAAAAQLAELLGRAGHASEVVPDAERALLSQEAKLFDLVMSELNLPGRGGVELLGAVLSRWAERPARSPSRPKDCVFYGRSAGRAMCASSRISSSGWSSSPKAHR